MTAAVLAIASDLGPSIACLVAAAVALAVMVAT